MLKSIEDQIIMYVEGYLDVIRDESVEGIIDMHADGSVGFSVSFPSQSNLTKNQATVLVLRAHLNQQVGFSEQEIQKVLETWYGYLLT